MGASSSTSATAVTIDKTVYEEYVKQHKLTLQQLDLMQSRVVTLQHEIDCTQMKLNKELDVKNVLSNRAPTLSRTLTENAILSKNLKSTEYSLNKLQIKYDILSKKNDELSNECETNKRRSEDTEEQLQATMIKLIRTKSDLEVVSEQLRKEIASKEVHLELENKYRLLEESRDKLERDLRETRDEFLAMKTAFTECTDENRVLEKKCKTYEDDVKKLNEDLIETKLEVDDVKLKNKKLQTNNTSLNDKLKMVTQNRSAMKEELLKKEELIVTQTDTIATLKDELLQNDVTDETLRKIIQIYRRIEDLRRECSANTDILVKTVKETRRDERDKLIENLKSDYDNCEKKLESKSISINRTHFVDIYAKYKHLCERNDADKKNLFKQVYEVGKFTADLRKRFDIFAGALCKGVEKAGKPAKNFNMNLLTEGFIAEEKLYRDVLKVVKEEIAYRETILNIDVGVANGNEIKAKDCNILNNGKPDRILPEETETQLQEDSNTEDHRKPIEAKSEGTPKGNLMKNEYNYRSRGRNNYKQFSNRRFANRGRQDTPSKFQHIKEN